MIADAIKTRNRQHLIKALALGLPLTGQAGHYKIGSESATGTEHRADLIDGRWYCGCRWAAGEHATGYDPHSNAKPCKHVLLAIAADLPIRRQDAIMRADPALRAAAESGAQLRATPARRLNAAIVAEAMVYATRARLDASPAPVEDGTQAAYLAARRQATIQRGAEAAADLWGAS